MSYPNVPLGKNDQDRRVAQAVNYVLNQLDYWVVDVQDGPLTDGEVLDRVLLPFPTGIVATSCYAEARTPAITADAVFSLQIDGVEVGTITFAPGETEGVFSFTVTELPALTDFEIVAPSPANAALDELTILIAFKY